MSKIDLTSRAARRLDDTQSVSEDHAAVEPAAKSTGRRGLFSRRASPTFVLNASSSQENSGKIQPDRARKSFGSNIPIERWFARFAVRVGGQIAWLTTCEQGRSLLFRYTSHFVILAVLIGAIGLVSTAKTTSASNFPERRTFTNGVNASSAFSTTGTISTTDDIIYNQFGQGGPIMVDQLDVVPQANPFTAVPSRERRGVISYTVQAGDTLFGIAAQFGLRPESVLWANYDTLQDNPHLLQPGMELALPPVNGIVYTVKDGDTVESIAEEYKVTPDAIYTAGFEWNQLKPGEQPVAGASLIIPGGSRDFKAWALTAQLNAPEPAANTNSAGVPIARTSNAGFCQNAPVGSVVGSGSFIWPAPKHWLSGNPYTGYHPGIDIAAKLGDPISAADSGVVVYAGWSNVGYGNLVVIDHGNGWQTWYAHNSEIYVTCGQGVNQGAVISAAGSTGRSTGPHLHFETRFNGTLPNPFNILPPP
jgi:murein DD-endopeptidase MepM/ murein hydrolase activator NlpD